jgi:hypothetical protein
MKIPDEEAYIISARNALRVLLSSQNAVTQLNIYLEMPK